LIDVIIDHLHDDIQSLKVCSLVCKSWTPSARFHLFSVFSSHRSTIRQLLESAPAVIPFIRHLRLYEKSWDHNLPLFVAFESIRSLTLIELPARGLRANVLCAFIRNFSAAVDLRLDGIPFDSIGQLVRFICAFPSLQRLAVTCQGIGPNDFGFDLPAPTAFSLSPHLRVLELDYVCMDAVLDWFLSLPNRPALRAVGLRPLDRNNSSTVAKLLLALEDSLEEFFISTTIAHGMFMIFFNLIHVAYYVRIALAI
jgi:hypothetical protein